MIWMVALHVIDIQPVVIAECAFDDLAMICSTRVADIADNRLPILHADGSGFARDFDANHVRNRRAALVANPSASLSFFRLGCFDREFLLLIEVLGQCPCLIESHAPGE